MRKYKTQKHILLSQFLRTSKDSSETRNQNLAYKQKQTVKENKNRSEFRQTPLTQRRGQQEQNYKNHNNKKRRETRKKKKEQDSILIMTERTLGKRVL